MISEACLVPCCFAGRDEFLEKMDDQCGEGCDSEIGCGITRLNGFKICAYAIIVCGIGIFLLPPYLFFSVLIDSGSCGQSCCDDDYRRCQRFCG